MKADAWSGIQHHLHVVLRARRGNRATRFRHRLFVAGGQVALPSCATSLGSVSVLRTMKFSFGMVVKVKLSQLPLHMLTKTSRISGTH